MVRYSNSPGRNKSKSSLGHGFHRRNYTVTHRRHQEGRGQRHVSVLSFAHATHSHHYPRLSGRVIWLADTPRIIVADRVGVHSIRAVCRILSPALEIPDGTRDLLRAALAQRSAACRHASQAQADPRCHAAQVILTSTQSPCTTATGAGSYKRLLYLGMMCLLGGKR